MVPFRPEDLRGGGGPVDVTDTPFLVDPCLPGAGLLLARGSLEGWLSERLGRPAQVTLRRLRYKPGTSLVLGFDLATDAHGAPRSCLAWAYADGSQAKLGKTLERLPPSTFLAYDARLTVLATTAGGDRYLPALARLERPGGLARTVQRVLPGLDALEDVRVRTLRHNPGRRWVGCLESGGDGVGAPVRAVLRAYPDQVQMGRAWGSYAAFARRGAPTQRPVGRFRKAAVIAVTWAEGRQLTRVDEPDRWRDVGATLARLHGAPRRRLERIGVESEIDAVSRTAGNIASLLPDLAPVTTSLTERVAGVLRQVPRDLVTIHGDFSPDQVVLDGHGEPCVIDLDAAGVGASAADVGCLRASISPGDEHLAEAALEGYGLVRRPPDRRAVAAYALAYGLRKAIDPFRDCAPDWPAAVTRRVLELEARCDRLENGEVNS